MSKRPRGNILKIREFELEKIHLVDEFDILQIVGEGWFGKILLVEHRASQTEMVLKAVPKPYVSLRDFYREFHYGLHLGIHRNIVTTYDVAFETAGFYVFTQEYAPLGDLTSNVTTTGVGEVYTKRVAKQIASALDYMHSKDIVHRDVKLDNVLIFRSDFTRVKICDFGESYQAGTVVERRNEWLPYSPPEVLEIKPEGTYKADPSHDVWQFGIVIFVCLTGCLPWQKASSDDPRYMRYLAWQGSMILPIRRTPKLFKLLSSRAQRMFRVFLEPRSERRPKGLADLSKFLDDRWLAKTAEKEMAQYETDELCPSMYSFHSSPDEKNRLLNSLADCGIETNVDRQTKKNRIKDWIESSVITEEDEEENEDANSTSPSSSVSREPVAGHISSIRTPIRSVDKPTDIKTTLKDAAQKHFDPRTGALQQGPSAMGGTQYMEKSASPSMSTVSMLNSLDSIGGSLLTLGSRPDLLNSNLQIYKSDMELPHLGEMTPSDLQHFNQALSSSNLLIMSNSAAGAAANMANAYTNPYNGSNMRDGGNATRTTRQFHSYGQRSRSDAVHKAMYASAPALDLNATSAKSFLTTAPTMTTTTTTATTTTNMHDLAQTNEQPITDTTGGGALAGNKTTTANSKSVTFAGLSNAFQSLAAIPMPTNTSVAMQYQQQQQQQQQRKQKSDFDWQRNDAQVRDSAYGSTDMSSFRSMSTQAPSTGNEVYKSNGYLNHNTYDGSRQQPSSRPGGAMVRSHSAQRQPHRYEGSQTSSSMKDTAYERSSLINSNSRIRR